MVEPICFLCRCMIRYPKPDCKCKCHYAPIGVEIIGKRLKGWSMPEEKATLSGDIKEAWRRAKEKYERKK